MERVTPEQTTILVAGITALLNAAGVVLAWAAKLRWSKEFAAAKDETIRTKEAQIASLASAKDEIIRVKEAQIAVLNQHLEALRETGISEGSRALPEAEGGT